MRISDWSSDVCSSDLCHQPGDACLGLGAQRHRGGAGADFRFGHFQISPLPLAGGVGGGRVYVHIGMVSARAHPQPLLQAGGEPIARSEEHTSELQSLMRISYAVFCLKKKNNYYTYASSH